MKQILVKVVRTMSKYTTEVRFICENSAGLKESEGANNVDSILDRCWDKVFNFEFPIFDENYRKVLCKNILKHYGYYIKDSI